MNEVQHEAAQEQRCEDLCLHHKDRFSAEAIELLHDPNVDCEDKLCRFGCPMSNPDKDFINKINDYCYRKRHELTLLGKEVQPLEEIIQMIKRYQFKDILKKGD